MPSLAFTAVLCQLLGFAFIAFPARTLWDSAHVALGGHGKEPDAPEMAVGVFAALGRAALAAGLNSVMLAAVYSFLVLPKPEQLASFMDLALASLGSAAVFQLFVARPLEQLALSKVTAARLRS